MSDVLQFPRLLSGEHRAYLNEHAVSDAVIAARGIRSDGNDIVVTWAEGELITEQRRPWPGGSGVYFWEPGKDLHLNILRDPGPEATILLVEGTKQSLAVDSWAPAEYAVIGMPGCYGWTMSHHLDLSKFAGRELLIMLDADAADNLDVYEAGERLARELSLEDPPGHALFIQSPAWGKDGIDDYLGRIAEGRRTDRLVKLLTEASDKPAGKKPARRKPRRPDTGDRPLVQVNKDRFEVICEITQHMMARFSGSVLFNFGGALTGLDFTTDSSGLVTSAKTEPLDKDTFARWLALAVSTFRLTAQGYEADWPDPQTRGAVLAGAGSFALLDRVSRIPFIRADGSVCAKQGYDPASRTYLVTGNSGMDRLDIPDMPTQDQARQAAAYLLGEWLGDMPWRDEASRAGALALVLTPLIRGNVPLVPLAVISGLQPGVGKGLLTDCISLMLAGEPEPTLPWLPDNDEENRKQITSAFRDGTSLFRFDETPVIESHALARALTSITYADRILGVSKMARFPNRVTWLANGNQVQVLGDMSRRAYFIELYPEGPDPQDRPESAFSHPDLREWTAANRPELITAALTVVRAWYAARCPAHSRGASMGSFERWDQMMSGILAHAGVTGFLGNLAARRAERDTTASYWAAHVAWLAARFGDAEFTLAEVRDAARVSGGTWEAPPRMENLEVAGYARLLGQAYAKIVDRWFGPYRIVKAGIGHAKTGKWAVQQGAGNEMAAEQGGRIREETRDRKIPVKNLEEREEREDIPKLGTGAGAGAGAGAHMHTREEGSGTLPILPILPVVQGGPRLDFDLETGDSDRLFTTPRGAPAEAGGFVRLAGITGPSGQNLVVPVPELLGLLGAAGTVAGHNILGFDALALAWHHGLDWNAFWPRARDTELIARQCWPPRSRESGSSADKLGLDAVAQLLELPGKGHDLKALARKHGGYGMIPLDDPEYLAYLNGDLDATRAVASHLLPVYESDPYLPREHRLAAIAGQITLNGFLIDQPLLRQRLDEGEQRKREALQCLHDGWGLPLSREVMRGRGKARHPETQEFDSPLSTGEGRAWLASMWERYQVPDPPKTDSGLLAIGTDELAAVAARPGCPGDLRAMLTLMNVVTGTRVVYQTITDYLAPDGRVHPRISMRQASGRWSFTKPGLTVLGKHDGRHAERDVLIADEDCDLWTCDLSQVDMRAIAGHCQDPAYIALLAPGRDVHSEIAARVFGEAPRDAKGRHPRRQDAKARGHGWNYGMGPARMIRDGVAPDMAYGFDNGMKTGFPVLCAWRDEVRAMAKAGMVLDNGFGRRMRADPRWAYTVAPALYGQGGARDIMGESLLRMPRELDPFLRGMVHDDVVVCTPKRDTAEIRHIVKAAMTWEWRNVPILCELSEIGRSWGEVSKE